VLPPSTPPRRGAASGTRLTMTVRGATSWGWVVRSERPGRMPTPSHFDPIDLDRSRNVYPAQIARKPAPMLGHRKFKGPGQGPRRAFDGLKCLDLAPAPSRRAVSAGPWIVHQVRWRSSPQDGRCGSGRGSGCEILLRLAHPHSGWWLRIQPLVSQDLVDYQPLEDGGNDLEFPAAAVRAPDL